MNAGFVTLSWEVRFLQTMAAWFRPLAAGLDGFQLVSQNFTDPTAVMAITDGHPSIFVAANSLVNGKPPSHELLGTLAWCHPRRQVVAAAEVVLKSGVPFANVRRVLHHKDISDLQSRNGPWEYAPRPVPGLKRSQMEEGSFLPFLSARWGFDIYLERERFLEIFCKGATPEERSELSAVATTLPCGETLLIYNLQCDGVRILPKEERDRFKHWERIFVEALEEQARQKKCRRVLIVTPYGAASHAGVYYLASVPNLLRVYLAPRQMGYRLVRLKENDPVHKSLKKLGHHLGPIRYFWEKRLVA